MTGTPGDYEGTEIQFKGYLLRDGFAQIPHTLIRTPKLKPSAKLVLFLLFSRATKDGMSFEGLEGMSTRMGLSKSSVQRALGELKSLGLVAWQRRGQGRTNVYFVLQTGVELTIQEWSERPSQNVHVDQSKVVTVTTKGYPVEEEPEKEEKKRPSSRVEKKEITPTFRQQMQERFGPILSDIPERIEEALSHSAAKKYDDQQAYVRGWLRRESEQRPLNGGSNGTARANPKPTERRPLTVYTIPRDAAGNVILGR